jgi:hypothetical protein
VWRHHVQRNGWVDGENLVLLKKPLRVPASQHRQLAFADLTEIRGGHATVLRPFVLLPGLEPLASWIARVRAHFR